MKSHPLKQLLPTMLDNAGSYHKVKKGIPRVLGAMASLFTGGSILGGVRTGLAKYPSYLPKGWNKGGSKKAFKHLMNPKPVATAMFRSIKTDPTHGINPPKMGPSKETINSILNYSKDFGPIIKNMKK